MPRCPRCVFAALALFAVALLGGCDTDNPSTPLEEIEGTYDFSRLYFVPTATAIDTARVDRKLVPSESYVQIRGTGRALIFFKLEGRPSDLADATATANSSSVQLTVAEADAARLRSILLPPQPRLTRSPDDRELSAQIPMTADLQAFDPEVYAGVPPVPGTLYVTLSRRIGV